MTKKIAIIGTGQWGKNLVRNFSELGVLEAICDVNLTIAQSLKDQYNISRVLTDCREIFSSSEFDAVVIATPAATHYEIVKAALLAGKDVFVEKPLALKIEEAEELIDLAEKKKKILMVDHILQYHPAVIKLKELIDKGVLGQLQYIYSHRLNIGKLRTEENILWSFAPHDISVILSLTGKQPEYVMTVGEAYLQDHIFDTTITHLMFQNQLKAHIYVSWIHPFKEQKLVVIGSTSMAVFDDLAKDEKLVLYPHKIEWIKQIPVAAQAAKEVISIDKKEPLKESCLHFLECIEKRTKPKTDGREALSVLKVLNQAQECLESKKRTKDH